MEAVIEEFEVAKRYFATACPQHENRHWKLPICLLVENSLGNWDGMACIRETLCARGRAGCSGGRSCQRRFPQSVLGEEAEGCDAVPVLGNFHFRIYGAAEIWILVALKLV